MGVALPEAGSSNHARFLEELALWTNLHTDFHAGHASLRSSQGWKHIPYPHSFAVLEFLILLFLE